MELTPQFLLEKILDALQQIARLTGLVERESARIDAVEDDVARVERRLEQEIHKITDRLDTDERDEAAEQRETRKAREDRTSGIIHGLVGAAAGAGATLLTNFVSHLLGTTSSTPHH